MKNDSIKKFMHAHRQPIPDGDFVPTLLRNIDRCPQQNVAPPAQQHSVAAWLPLISTVAALVIVGAFGGWHLLLDASDGFRFYGINLLQLALCATVAALLTLTSLLSGREETMI
jgi:hypothetical protein